MFKGMPDTRSGNFSMSIISIGSAFERPSAGGGYHSGTFERFRRNLDVIRDRVESQFLGAQYPQGALLPERHSIRQTALSASTHRMS